MKAALRAHPWTRLRVSAALRVSLRSWPVGGPASARWSLSEVDSGVAFPLPSSWLSLDAADGNRGSARALGSLRANGFLALVPGATGLPSSLCPPAWPLKTSLGPSLLTSLARLLMSSGLTASFPPPASSSSTSRSSPRKRPSSASNACVLAGALPALPTPAPGRLPCTVLCPASWRPAPEGLFPSLPSAAPLASACSPPEPLTQSLRGPLRRAELPLVAP